MSYIYIYIYILFEMADKDLVFSLLLSFSFFSVSEEDVRTVTSDLLSFLLSCRARPYNGAPNDTQTHSPNSLLSFSLRCSTKPR